MHAYRDRSQSPQVSTLKATSVTCRVDVSTLASLAMKQRDIRQAPWNCLMIPGAGGRDTGRAMAGALDTGSQGNDRGFFSPRARPTARLAASQRALVCCSRGCAATPKSPSVVPFEWPRPATRCIFLGDSSEYASTLGWRCARVLRLALKNRGSTSQ